MVNPVRCSLNQSCEALLHLGRASSFRNSCAQRMYPPIPSDLIGELQFNDDRWVNVLAARRGGGGGGGENG